MRRFRKNEVKKRDLVKCFVCKKKIHNGKFVNVGDVKRHVRCYAGSYNWLKNPNNRKSKLYPLFADNGI